MPVGAIMRIGFAIKDDVNLPAQLFTFYFVITTFSRFGGVQGYQKAES